jgi:hypothetical protein
MNIIKYNTTDIVLAACLKLSNYNLLTINVNGNKGIFIFENVDEQFLVDYDLGKHLVEPVSFNSTIKQLTTSVRRLSTNL